MMAGIKPKPKYLGPYAILKVKSNNTYDVENNGFHERPLKTYLCQIHETMD